MMCVGLVTSIWSIIHWSTMLNVESTFGLLANEWVLTIDCLKWNMIMLCLLNLLLATWPLVYFFYLITYNLWCIMIMDNYIILTFYILYFIILYLYSMFVIMYWMYGYGPLQWFDTQSNKHIVFLWSINTILIYIYINTIMLNLRV